MADKDDFRRQLELYDADNRNDRIGVIGAGATGSWVALLLSKLGVAHLDIADGDIVEPHNLPNQVYGRDNIGKLKTASIVDIVNMLGSAKTALFLHPKMIQSIDDYKSIAAMNSVIFCLVDSMSARKDLFEKAVFIRDKSEDKEAYPRYWIETRMGLTGYRIYLVDMDDVFQVNEYVKTLYSDEEAEVSACGASSSVVTTAVQCASHAVGMWLALINNAEYIPNEIIYDVHSTLLLQRKFEPKE